MPDLRAPDFLADLFYDLHDRRLLAPIALLIVAIAAVPFLLGGSSEEPAPAPDAAPAEVEAGKSATLTVVEAKPGLRDYRKRLAARQPTDPFAQHYASPTLEGSELSSPAESSSSSTTVVPTSSSGEGTTVSGETTTGSPSYTPPVSTPSPSGGGDGKPDPTFLTWAIDVRIVRSGGKDAAPDASGEPTFKRKLLPQTSIPGPKAPVVTYMGLSRKAAEKHHAKALLLVSDEVGSLSGKGVCVSGEEVCQLVEVEPGLPVTCVYGANETRFTFRVLKVEPVRIGHS